MSIKSTRLAETIADEVVRQATQQEADSLRFLNRRRGNISLEKDVTLRKVFNLLTEVPDATALVIDTSMSRMTSLRQNLSKLGIQVETCEAVEEYGQDSEPTTIAIRKMRPPKLMVTEEKRVEKKIPRIWSKET